MEVGECLHELHSWVCCTRRQHELIWVIVDRLIKSAHFHPIKVTYSAEDYANLYLKEILNLHGASLSIILYRVTQFNSYFWKDFQSEISTKVKLSTTFNPKTDGQEERTIQTQEDMLRACVIEFEENWDGHLPLI